MKILQGEFSGNLDGMLSMNTDFKRTRSSQNTKSSLLSQPCCWLMPLVVPALLLAAGSGCSSLSMLNSGDIMKPGTSTSPKVAQKQMYRVELEGSFGKSKQYVGTIDGPTTVQTALEQSGAIKKFRTMEVAVFRKIEGQYQPLKMVADYSPSTRTVEPATDYALQHGDHIQVSAKSDNGLMQMLGTFGDAK